MVKLYAQLNSENICTCVGTPKTDLEVQDESMLGKKRVWVETYYDEEQEIDVLEHWEWQDVPLEPEAYQPTNAEIAQLLSDLQADLIIAGVI